MMSSLLEYEDKDTFIHNLSPLTKILAVFAFWITSFILFDPISLLILVAASLVLWTIAKIEFSEFKVILAELSLVFLIFTLINGFMYYRGKTPIFYLFGYAFTWEGLIFGITLSIKVLSVVTVIPILTRTTKIEELLASLAKIKVPYSILFTFGMGMRFANLVSQVLDDIKDSQKLRGHDISEMGLIKKLKDGYVPIFAPLVLTLLRRASDLDIALQSRAFGNPGKRTFISYQPLRKADIGFLVFAVAFAGMVLYYGLQYGQVMLILPT